MSGNFLVAGAIFAMAIGPSSKNIPALAQTGSSAPVSTISNRDQSVTETHWNLVELEGSAVSAKTPESQPYIYLQAEGDKLSGSGGCNRLFGSYDLSGSSLQFHSVASTRMACPGMSMDDESGLLEALKLTTSFRIVDGVLTLRVDDRVLARFKPMIVKK